MIKLAIAVLLVVQTAAFPRTNRFPGNGKIIGGEEAQIGQFPHQLSLTWNGAHICGAVIIANNWALTAAHCVDGDSPNVIRLIAGKHERLGTQPENQLRRIDSIMVHPGYNADTHLNDIALLALEKENPFQFNRFVQPISLPDQGQQTEHEVTLTGWGSTFQGGEFSATLRFVVLPTIPDAECQRLYPGNIIAESMLCAGIGGRDSCQGDTGGPVISNDGGYLAGIISWAIGCALPNKPGVNTEVSYFIDWIESTMRKDPNNNSTRLDLL